MTIQRNVGGSQSTKSESEQNNPTQAQQPAHQGFYGETTSEQPAKKFALSRLSNIGISPINRRSGSEVAVELANAMDEIIEKYKIGNSVQTMTIEPKHAAGLHYSSIAVIYTDSNKRVSSFHLLPIAASSESSGAPLVENIPSFGPIETRITPGCSMTENAVTAVAEYLKSRLGHTVLYAASCIVPATFNTKDAASVYRLLANAATAAATTLGIRSGAADLDLSQTSFDEQLSVRISGQEEHMIGIDSLPVRADICVEILSQPMNRNNGLDGALQRHASDGLGAKVLTQLIGYVDFLAAPADQNQIGGFGLARPTQALRPRIMITDFQAIESISQSMQLLALISSKKLTESYGWSGAFNVQHRQLGKKEIDFKNIGAIGYVLETLPGNLPGHSPVDTSPDKFNSQVLRVLLNHGVWPEPIITMLIDEAGPQTWINSIFLAAGRRNESAVKALVAACNKLTGGHFNKYYDPSKPLAIAEDNRIHAGTWRDPKDRIRDLLEFDYLAAMNFYGANGNIDAIHTFSDSYVDEAIPLKVRLDRRWNLIAGALGPSARVTGYKRPVNLTPNLLVSLVRGAADCSLSMNPIYNLGEAMGSLSRPSLNTAGLTFGSDISSLFSGSSGNGGGLNMSGLGSGNFSGVLW